MQPSRPFRGCQYDTDMFTFLPAHSNRDTLVEKPRKRKLMSPDHQITMSAPTAGYGFSGILERKLNAGDLQSKEFQTSAPSSTMRDSSNFSDYSDKSRCWDRNNYSASWNPNKRGFYESKPEYTGYSSLKEQLQSPTHKDSLPVFPISEGRSHETLNWSPVSPAHLKQHESHELNAHIVSHKTLNGVPAVTEDFNRQEICESNAHVAFRNTSTWSSSGSEGFNLHENRESNVHVARVENAPHFQQFWNYGQQKSVQARVMALDSYEQASKSLGESQSWTQNFLNQGALVRGLDEKGHREEETCKVNSSSNFTGSDDVGRFAGLNSTEANNVESSSNVRGSGNAGGFARIDSTKIPVNNARYNLQFETNSLLQNALRLLSSSTGIGLANNNDDNTQGCGLDVKMLKSAPDSGIQNLEDPPVETTPSKNHEGGPSLDKPAMNGGNVSVKSNDKCRSGNGASGLAEKLWNGTLQLSSSVSVSAIAFFKSGEKMQDFSWSESVEVKGKVRLEAFEKYVQDLPRSRSRGLMVMSLCSKEGSSDADHKGMKEIARKYKEGKRVGFAQLSSGVDLYICPHSDTIITILAKYGFFKGMTAITNKCDPLIGCVVWKKNSSSAPATKMAEVNAPQSGQSLISPSDSDAKQITGEISTMVDEKSQIPTKGGENNREDRTTELKTETKTPSKEPATVGSWPEFKTEVELNKPIQPLPSVASKQSEAASSDDDDLPEFDFRAAVSQTSVSRASEVGAPNSRLEMGQFRASHVPKPISASMRSESSSVSGSLANFGFQGLDPKTIKHYSEAHNPSFPTQEHKKSGHCQGLAPQSIGHQPEVKISSLPIQEQKQIEKSAASLKPKNLFDDDDMPEWNPPDFMKTRQEVTTRTGPSLSSSHSKVLGSDLASGCLPALPRTPPPLTQVQFQDRNYPSASHLPKPATNDFRRQSPADLSTQMQFPERDYRSAPYLPTPMADKPTGDGFMHQSSVVPSGLAPNPAFRPQFDQPSTKNPIHPSARSSSRP